MYSFVFSLQKKHGKFCSAVGKPYLELHKNNAIIKQGVYFNFACIWFIALILKYYWNIEILKLYCRLIIEAINLMNEVKIKNII